MKIKIKIPYEECVKTKAEINEYVYKELDKIFDKQIVDIVDTNWFLEDSHNGVIFCMKIEFPLQHEWNF